MLRLIREIVTDGQIHLMLSSHLLRDVEQCCEEVLILKQGEIAVYCNLEEERRANRKFVEVEARGDSENFIQRLEAMGCEWARRLKMVLPEGLNVSHIFEVAAQTDTQLRRLSYKRDSLEDIFLKAMGTENGSL